MKRQKRKENTRSFRNRKIKKVRKGGLLWTKLTCLVDIALFGRSLCLLYRFKDFPLAPLLSFSPVLSHLQLCIDIRHLLLSLSLSALPSSTIPILRVYSYSHRLPTFKPIVSSSPPLPWPTIIHTEGSY